MNKSAIVTLLGLLIVAIGLSACQPVMMPSAEVQAATNDEMVGAEDSVGKVLQIHFQYDITSDEYRGAATSLADTFAQLDGLRWKIWTLNEETGEAGGIFLFDDEASRQGYLDGLYQEVIGSNPAFHDAVIKKFDAIEDATQVTHGPVGTEAMAVAGPVGKVLQIHFQYDITSDEYRGAATSLADTFAQLDGLRWKIWTLNEETGEAGGIFLFDDEASRQGYLDGLYQEVIGSNPAFHDAVIKKFDVIEDATQVTHGPVGTEAMAVAGPVGKVLQIHFQYDITSDEYRGAATSLADTFAQLDGLRWKIWTLNEETGEAGGIFLFDDEASRQGYLDGLYQEVIGSNPAFHDAVIKKFDAIEDATQVTHGPVGTEAMAVAGPVGKVLQIHFQYDITSDEYRGAATSLADTFAQLDGLRWKIWTLNEETGEAGGIFLFDDEALRQGYLDGLYQEVIGSNPAFHDAMIKKFDVIEDATQVTHGPVGM